MLKLKEKQEEKKKRSKNQFYDLPLSKKYRAVTLLCYILFILQCAVDCCLEVVVVHFNLGDTALHYTLYLSLVLRKAPYKEPDASQTKGHARSFRGRC